MVTEFEIPFWMVECLENVLMKGAGHKYVRRVPTGNPKRPWKYFYNVAGGAGGIGHESEFEVGAAFRMKHGGQEGHFHIVGKTEDGGLRIRHDETGHVEIVDAHVLRAMLHREHAEAIGAHRDRLRRDLAQVHKTGTKRQRDRLVTEAAKYGIKHEEPAAKSLTETLREHGYTHRKAEGAPGDVGRQDILDASGKVVFQGSAGDVWAWLKQQPESSAGAKVLAFPERPKPSTKGTPNDPEFRASVHEFLTKQLGISPEKAARVMGQADATLAAENTVPMKPESRTTGREGGEFRGSKYEPKKDVKDIAADVRAAIKEKHPGVKASVQIRRFSGGQSIDVEVKGAPFEILNPERVKWEKANPHGIPPRHGPESERFTPEGKALLEAIESELNAHNRDNSDSQSDYFDVHFYGHATIGHDLEKRERERILRGEPFQPPEPPKGGGKPRARDKLAEVVSGASSATPGPSASASAASPSGSVQIVDSQTKAGKPAVVAKGTPRVEPARFKELVAAGRESGVWFDGGWKARDRATLEAFLGKHGLGGGAPAAVQVASVSVDGPSSFVTKEQLRQEAARVSAPAPRDETMTHTRTGPKPATPLPLDERKAAKAIRTLFESYDNVEEVKRGPWEHRQHRAVFVLPDGSHVRVTANDGFGTMGARSTSSLHKIERRQPDGTWKEDSTPAFSPTEAARQIVQGHTAVESSPAPTPASARPRDALLAELPTSGIVEHRRREPLTDMIHTETTDLDEYRARWAEAAKGFDDKELRRRIEAYRGNTTILRYNSVAERAKNKVSLEVLEAERARRKAEKAVSARPLSAKDAEDAALAQREAAKNPPKPALEGRAAELQARGEKLPPGLHRNAVLNHVASGHLDDAEKALKAGEKHAERWARTKGQPADAPRPRDLLDVTGNKADAAAREANRPAADAAESLGLKVSKDDIPYSVAHAAHAGSSFVPERRAHQRQQEYVDHINAVAANLSRYADTPEKKAMLAEEMARYQTGYRERLLASLHADSRTMSSMITGSSNFPTARNQKRLETAHRRTTELLEWSEKARNAIKNKLAPTSISSDRDDAVEALQKKITDAKKFQEGAKAVNAILRKKGLSDEEKVRAVAALGYKEESARAWLKPDFAGRIGIPSYVLQNNLANIKRMEERVAQVSREKSSDTREHTFGDVRIVDSAEDNRIQVFYPGKPDPATIAKLKANGFRWSPSAGAWQRHRNDQTRAVLARNFGFDIGGGAAPSQSAAAASAAPPSKPAPAPAGTRTDFDPAHLSTAAVGSVIHAPDGETVLATKRERGWYDSDGIKIDMKSLAQSMKRTQDFEDQFGQGRKVTMLHGGDSSIRKAMDVGTDAPKCHCGKTMRRCRCKLEWSCNACGAHGLDDSRKAPHRVELGPPPARNRARFPFQGTIDYQGLKIRVENSKGTTRRGVDGDGNPWSVTMPAHYGEFAATEGTDGDPVDVFVGEDPHAPFAYVVALQRIGDEGPTGEHDEDKVFVGFPTAEACLECFRAAYDRKDLRLGPMRKMSMGELRAWLRDQKGARIEGGRALSKAYPVCDSPLTQARARDMLNAYL